MTMRFVSGLAALLLAASISPAAQAQSADARTVATPAASESVPRLVQFSGTLKDSAARPVTGVASVTFAIYAEQDGGAALWTETQNVLADANGHYTALLGTATSGGFPAELIGTGQSRWLGVSIARQEEAPRVLLASVPYALKAGDADTLGGLPASSYVTTQQLAARSATPVVTGGGSTIIATPGVASAQTSQGAASANSAQSSVIDATPTGSGTTDFIPLWTSGSNLGNSILFQTGGKIGLGTTAPLSTLDINGGEILRGGFYEYPQGTATASTGQPSHSFQWIASVFNSTTKVADYEAFGFRALPVSNNTSTPSAKLDLFSGSGGPDGTLNDTGLSIASSGVITFVPSQTFNGSTVNLPNSGTNLTGTVAIGGSPFLADYGGTTNTFVGNFSGGSAATTGTYNAAIGAYSLDFNTTGGGNAALGTFALWKNTSGSENVALGDGAMAANTTGGDNVAIGSQALPNSTTGNGNIAIGNFAGYDNATGSFNTLIGNSADVSAAGLSNATAIGSSAVVSESNAIVLGSTGSSAPAVGIGTTTPGHTLDVVDRGTGGAGIYSSSTVVGDSAVIGINSATSGKGTNGGQFQSLSPNGAGVAAFDDVGGYAGYFEALNGGYAGYFAGSVTVTGNENVLGTLSKGAGSFKIDDPIDPANKYLSHSFVESPDMMNIYNGNVTTDAHGYATVTMPAWFEALNRDFRYQLTTINSFSRATVAAELKDGKFRIRTSQPHVKVSWQVTGIRHDAYADAHRIPTEEEKPADEQGKYLHPELFGAGPEKSVAAARTAPAPTSANAEAERARTTSTAGNK